MDDPQDTATNDPRERRRCGIAAAARAIGANRFTASSASALVQAPAHERTVHPELARVVVLGLRRRPSTHTVRTVHTLLDLDRPIPESLHRRLLTELAVHGWPAIAAAAAHLLDPRRDPDF